MSNDDYNYEFEDDEEDLDEEDLIIFAAATAGIAAGLTVIASSSQHKNSALVKASLDRVKENLDMISNSLRELASECQLRQLQSDADAGHTQGGEAESLQCRHSAMRRVQQIETHLDASHAMALVDLVANNTIAADIYMSIEREDYRHAWVALKLKEMGFNVQ